MSLEKTKEILNNLKNKLGEDLTYTVIDIKPQYGANTGKGYPYYDIDDSDRDTIYNSIKELQHIINNPQESITFDIKNVFLTEERAIKSLRDSKLWIDKKLEELNVIKNKYNKSHYPIQVVIFKYEEVSDVLKTIFDSSELREFENPNSYKILEDENFELRFEKHWNRKKQLHILHFLLFIPFVCGIAYFFIHKDDATNSEFGRKTILVVCSLMTILFNYFYNNHSSFKDFWRLLFEKTRKELEKQEREKFKK